MERPEAKTIGEINENKKKNVLLREDIRALAMNSEKFR